MLALNSNGGVYSKMHYVWDLGTSSFLSDLVMGRKMFLLVLISARAGKNSGKAADSIVS